MFGSTGSRAAVSSKKLTPTWFGAALPNHKLNRAVALPDSRLCRKSRSIRGSTGVPSPQKYKRMLEFPLNSVLRMGPGIGPGIRKRQTVMIS